MKNTKEEKNCKVDLDQDNADFDATLQSLVTARIKLFDKFSKNSQRKAEQNPKSPKFSNYKRKTGWFVNLMTVVLFFVYAIPIAFPNISSAQKDFCTIIFDLTWVIFVVDFVIRFCLAARKVDFIRSNPIDIISIAVPQLRPLRLARMATLITVFSRFVKMNKRTEFTVYAIYSFSMIAIIGGLAMTDAERGVPGATINSVWDGLYWAITTITCTGYGSHYPVTRAGQLIAVVLMICGVVMIGVAARAAAAHFAHSTRKDNIAYMIAHSEELKEQGQNIAAKIREERKKLEADED